MQKRVFDIIVSFAILIVIWPLLVFAFLLASYDTKSFGVFYQDRVGQYGVIFKIFKLKTMTWSDQNHSKISKIGFTLRKYKIDELPQLFNILKGEMSIVGPRPDIEGYYDNLQGSQRELLKLKPGLTSRASIKYRNEEEILKQQSNPLLYNDTVIFPDKVKMNLLYLQNQSLLEDTRIIIQTLITYLT